MSVGGVILLGISQINSYPEGCIGDQHILSECLIYIVFINVGPGIIFLMCLEIFAWLEAENLFLVHNSSK